MTKRLLFISYAHKDRECLEELKPHLTDLSLEERLSVWSDDEGIEAGDAWREKIDQALERADVAVLLISANFLSSPFIRNDELPHLIKRKEAGGLKRLIPIIVKPCDWKTLGEIEKGQVLPKGARPLSSIKDISERDEVLTQIGREIQDYVHSYGEVHVERGGKPEESGGKDPGRGPIGLHQAEPLDWETLRPYTVMELRLRQMDLGLYNIELQFSQSEGDRYNERPQPYPVTLDFEELDRRKNDVAAYREYLETALFREPNKWSVLEDARRRANSKRVPLRFRVRLYPNSRELHRVQWELLCSDKPEHPLYLRELAFSRDLCAFGHRWQQVKVRPRSQPLKLLLGVAAPPHPYQSVRREAVSAIDAQAETGILAGALEQPGLAPVTLEKQLGLDCLITRLSEGYDILILIGRAHVEKNGETFLELLGADGDAELVDSKTLAERLEAVSTLPRLLVLSPPMDGGPPQWETLENWLRMAPCFQRAGIPAVVGLQRPMESGSWSQFLAALLAELVDTSRIDAAVAAARAGLRGDDIWAPVFFSRLRTSRFWYIPGFLDARKGEIAWENLVDSIKNGRCTPVLGPGVSRKVLRSRREIAMELADQFYYPLGVHERLNFVQVAQYIAADRGKTKLHDAYDARIRRYLLKHFRSCVTGSDAEGISAEREAEKVDEVMRANLDDLVSRVGSEEMKKADEPHRLLAEWKFPLYITANLNRLMALALEWADVQKVQERMFPLGDVPAGQATPKKPDHDKPLVYYLFGRLRDLRNAVLTEDDYFRFLVAFQKNKELLPPIVKTALNNNNLLFLGFKLHQWEFRVMLHSLLNMEGRLARDQEPFSHVAVQIDPDDDYVSDPDRTRDYLEHCFDSRGLQLYWGSTQDFLKELKSRCSQAGIS